ncbi:MAG: hypothetical protein LQ345_001640 [Seirophora villosa]|nr:MAG: hypothetical protein LQ345_001640 [Seirophora villosa]
MPSATLHTLSADEIDDLLYLARTNAHQDLAAGIEAIAQAESVPPTGIISATVDPESGNSLLHMAAANGCIDTLDFLIPSSSSSSPIPLNPNLQNGSGNTPLHWAALNGHLAAVKRLVGAGADPTVRNHAGHDAVYEAERSGKDDVARWLISKGEGLERGVQRSGGDAEEEVEEQEAQELAANEDGEQKDGDGVQDVQNGVADMRVKESSG